MDNNEWRINFVQLLRVQQHLGQSHEVCFTRLLSQTEENQQKVMFIESIGPFTRSSLASANQAPTRIEPLPSEEGQMRKECAECDLEEFSVQHKKRKLEKYASINELG